MRLLLLQVALIAAVPAVVKCSIALASPIILFTGIEGEKLSMSEQEGQFNSQEACQVSKAGNDVQPYSKTAGPNDAMDRTKPIFLIINPTVSDTQYETDIPVNLLVFLKGHHSSIDIDSLHIEGKHGIFPLNITDRLMPFLRQPIGYENAGYVIEGSIPSLRPDRYHMVMSLADVFGNDREKSLFLRTISE